MRKNCLDYPVEFVDDVFADGKTALADMVRKVTGAEKPRVMLIADQNVVSHTEGLGTRIGRWMQANGIALASNPVIPVGGERAKRGDFACAIELARTMVKAKIGVKDVALIIGGGTILDVAGWAAAQVRGGVPAIRIPTTPVAMMDGAFADYAALNAPLVKDAIRIPSVPAGVIIDTTFLSTILDGVWRAGVPTAMRQAAVMDAALLKKVAKIIPQLRERDLEAMKVLVEATVASRMKKGGSDFALWATHRLEALSGYNLPHGYAIALGIAIDTGYAVLKGAMKEADRQTIMDIIVQSGAMEGAMHSKHLLGDPTLLMGLDAWQLTTGKDAITIPAGLGKSETEENPDRDTMKQAINLLK